MSDFLVVGGGIAGLSVAARLAALGTVTLLEAEDALGYHASGRSAALYEASYGAPSVVALNRASRDDLEVRQVLSPRGFMLLGTDDRRAAFDADLAAMGMAPMDTAEAHAKVPILDLSAVHRVGYNADAWDIDTDRLLQSFAREVRANGTIHTGARVTALHREADGWTAATAEGDHAGRILVNAAGAWADGIAALAGVAPVGLQAYRRSMARIPAPGGHDVSRWPMIFGAGESWYAKPDAGCLIVSPAEEDPADPHDAWADDMVLAEGLARYEQHVTEPVTRMLGNWAGLRTFAPDRALVIGFDPGEPAFFWHAGQGGYGFQTSPAASRHAADLIAGRPPALGADLAAALSPARFR